MKIEKQLRCTKTLEYQAGCIDFIKGMTYEVIGYRDDKIILRDELGEEHSILKWKIYFKSIKK
jgi:hypothetical protein